MNTKAGKNPARTVTDAEAQRGEVLLYRSKKGQPAVDGVLDRDTLWFTPNQISDLFGGDKSVISRHLKNVYATRELSRKATVAKNATVHKEAGRKVKRLVDYYSPDAIVSVRYRVNPKRGTQFRMWATKTLKGHLTRGYALKYHRLEQSAREPVVAVCGAFR